MQTIGVLAFQGDVAEHLSILHALSMHAIEVRTLADLQQVHGLIIPGGESTVIGKFMAMTGVGEEVVRRVRLSGGNKLSVYGTCAGAILIAKNVQGKNAPRPLGLIDITVDRNAYGNQIHSFEADISVRGLKAPVLASFIRAPKITRVGENMDVLATHGGLPVLVRHGSVLAGTFHPEIRSEKAIHQMFLNLL